MSTALAAFLPESFPAKLGMRLFVRRPKSVAVRAAPLIQTEPFAKLSAEQEKSYARSSSNVRKGSSSRPAPNLIGAFQRKSLARIAIAIA